MVTSSRWCQLNERNKFNLISLNRKESLIWSGYFLFAQIKCCHSARKKTEWNKERISLTISMKLSERFIDLQQFNFHCATEAGHITHFNNMVYQQHFFSNNTIGVY